MARIILLRRVKLKNILSHEQSEIELRPGLTAIVGPNGAGKSTIIDSIVYALFARGPRSSIRGKSKRDLIRRGAAEGEIEVDIDIGGQRYRIRRVISTVRAEDAQLYQLDGETGRLRLIATGVDNVVDHILKLFGVPTPEAIRYTIISRQDELTKLLDLRPAERKDMILKLLGLHDLEKAREVLRPYLKKYMQEAAKLDITRIEIERRKRKLESIVKELSNIEKKLGELEEKRSSLSRELENLKQVQRIFLEYDKVRELEKKASELIEIERELEKLEEALSYAAGIRSVDPSAILVQLRELSQVKRALDTLRRKYDQVLGDIKRIVERLRKLGIEVNAEKGLEILRRELDALRARKHRIEAETHVFTEASKVISESSSCPICGRPLDDELRQRLEIELEEKTKRSYAELRDIERLEREIERALAELEALERARIDTASRIETYREQLEHIVPHLRPLIAKANQLCESVSKVHMFASCFEENRSCFEALKCVQQRLDSIEGRVSTLRERRKALYEELAGKSIDEILKEAELLRGRLRALGIDPDHTSYSEIEERLNYVNTVLLEVERNISSLKQRYSDLLQQRSEIEKEIKELEASIRDLEKAVRIARALEYLAETILGRDGELAKQLTTLAKDLIERYANMVLKNLGLGLQLSITQDFDISVHSPLGEIDIRSVSGGEKTAIATALRMALAYAILGRIPGFFILDEPTAHLDTERRRVLFDLIKRISEKLPQVIVVTHDIEVVDIADNVLEVYKEGTRSVVRYTQPMEFS